MTRAPSRPSRGAAWPRSSTQRQVPQAQRSVYVNMAGDSGPIIGDLDPRNNEGVMRPFDEAQAQAYADEWTQENPQDSDEKPG